MYVKAEGVTQTAFLIFSINNRPHICTAPQYSFFTKATELDRLDRTYASMVDRVQELDETKVKVALSLDSAKENVKQLKAEWEEFQKLEKLEDNVADLRVEYAWSVHHEMATKKMLESQVRIYR